MISASNVYKRFGSSTVLENLSISVKKGSIFALLGPNGAGKTTFVKSMLGLVKPDAGSISIGGVDYHEEGARKGVAFLPEKFSFFPYYTVEAVVSFYGQMQDLHGQELKDHAASALERLNISHIAKKRVDKISKGQLQRVGIANLLMGNNDLLILDEPFSGLDPIGIKELKDLLLNLKNEGKTIFINSHILSEMEQICDHLAILDKGKCLAQGALDEVVKDQSLEDFFFNIVRGSEN